LWLHCNISCLLPSFTVPKKRPDRVRLVVMMNSGVSNGHRRLTVHYVLHHLKCSVITLSDQYYWLLLAGFQTRIWAVAEWVTIYTVSRPAGCDRRYWSGKIMSSCIYTRALRKLSVPWFAGLGSKYLSNWDSNF